MMNISNLIIAGITFIIFSCVAIYLYNNSIRNVNNINGVIEKFQGISTQNPITIADMATSIMNDNKPYESILVSFSGRNKSTNNTINLLELTSNYSSTSNTIMPLSTANIVYNPGNNIILNAGKYKVTATVNKFVKNPGADANIHLVIKANNTTVLSKTGILIANTNVFAFLTSTCIIDVTSNNFNYYISAYLELDSNGSVYTLQSTTLYDTWVSILVEKIQ